MENLVHIVKVQTQVIVNIIEIGYVIVVENILVKWRKV